MTYSSALRYLLGLANVNRREYLKDRRHCAIYLERTKALLAILGNPQNKIPHYIHVTGTSGKGSVSRMCASILRASGARVGLVTSPHPSDIIERWEVNGRDMSRAEFVGAVEQLQKAIDIFGATTTYDIPSFFELMTVLAFMHFANKKVDWAVLEVGCGGRFDATNVIPRADAALITNIGLDHAEIIGPTKKDIAYEKCGIIKPGSLVFTAEKNPSLLKIFARECEKNNTTLNKIDPTRLHISKSTVDGTSFTIDKKPLALSLVGRHQPGNALLASTALGALGFSPGTIRRGLKNTTAPVCMEVASRQPLVIFDGAHNPDKMATTVAATLDLKSQKAFRHLHLVVGFAADKKIIPMLKHLAALKPKTIACTIFTANGTRRTADPYALKRHVKKLLPATTAQAFLDPRQALAWSRQQQKSDELVLVTGSIFLAGELRALL